MGEGSATMNAIEIGSLVLQLLIPLVLIGWVAIPRYRNRVSWGVAVALAASYVAAVALSAPWLALPTGVVLLHAALLLAAAVAAFRRVEAAPWTRRSAGGTIAAATLALALSAVAAHAAWGRAPFEQPALDLAFPLRGGTYLVASGGSNILVNPHLKTLTGERFADYTGQSFAVDLVKVGAWGSRLSSLSPNDPSGFAIFGDAVLAPCDGEVIVASDGQSDRLPAGVSPETLTGNHVILACGDRWIVMAHMKQESVSVEAGDHVKVGDPLGLVGDSGRSDEPHLHIHAQTPGTSAAPLSGDPVPITFHGRNLARGDRVRTTRAEKAVR